MDSQSERDLGAECPRQAKADLGWVGEAWPSITWHGTNWPRRPPSMERTSATTTGQPGRTLCWGLIQACSNKFGWWWWWWWWVNRRPVLKGRKIASEKLEFLYAFAIITIIKWLVQLTTVLNTATADAHTVYVSTKPQRIDNVLISTWVTTGFWEK